MPAPVLISPRKVALPTAKGLVFFYLHDLVHFEAVNKECILHYRDCGGIKRIPIFHGISFLNAKLSDHGFLLIRRDTLINAERIQSVTPEKTILMEGGAVLHPSHRKLILVEDYIALHFSL